VLPHRPTIIPLLLALGLVTGPAPAQFAPAGGSGQSAGQLVSVEVRADARQVVPGRPFHLVVDFRIEPGWHLYWKNPGPGGGAPPMEVTVRTPPGYGVGDVRWPRPRVIESPLGDIYGYEDRAALFVPLTPPVGMTAGETVFSVELAFAVCDENKCLLGDALEMTTVSASGRPGPPRPSDDPEIESARRRLPAPLAEVEGASVTLEDGVLTVRGPARGHATGVFFPHDAPGVGFADAAVKVEDDRFVLTARVEIDRNNLQGAPPAVGGLIALGDAPDDPSFEFEVP
jgi:thiol:disulfide interchange protein DsbD